MHESVTNRRLVDDTVLWIENMETVIGVVAILTTTKLIVQCKDIVL